MDIPSKIRYNSRMKFGDILQGTITRFDAKGRGVFDAPKGDGGNRPVIVPFATLGDTVEVSFIKRQEGCSITNLVRVLSAGPSRRSEALSKSLPHNPGMLWAHINYDDQISFKQEMINDALEGAGHDERVEHIIPCPPTVAANGHAAEDRLYYRNRMDYAIGWKGEVGLKEYGSWNRYIDLKDCLLLSPEAPKILEAFRGFMAKHPELKPWDAKRQEGDLRYLVVREGKQTNDRLIAIIVKDLERFSDEVRKDLVDQLDRFADNIVLGENPAVTDLSFGRTTVALKGKETFDEIVNGTRYTIQLNSFFQTNPLMAAKLQDVVMDFVSTTPHSPLPSTLLDLYCGLGFFAINAAQRFPNIKATGFEIYKHMIELAGINAQQNEVGDRCVFESGKAEELSWKDIEADVVIVDPPRAGLHHRVIETLLEKSPKTIIYVSCDYHHLVKELTQFKTKYEIKNITALDLFPHTPHVEVVVKMALKSGIMSS
ncbi:MAG: 23S rRNA (uracil(1939)-C(5))-methyltransferase RlmD [Candidatus Uhrbacteria bacterium]|nr:23S rRNA (uracil(1939)-C(5))-methyltransferase RlmD [Candidatus Uhrbacteria bacterium]